MCLACLSVKDEGRGGDSRSRAISGISRWGRQEKKRGSGGVDKESNHRQIPLKIRTKNKTIKNFRWVFTAFLTYFFNKLTKAKIFFSMGEVSFRDYQSLLVSVEGRF